MTHMLFVRSSGVGEDHVFGRKLVLESCRRSSDVNFHFWLWAASSTNVRCRALRAGLDHFGVVEVPDARTVYEKAVQDFTETAQPSP